MNAQQNELLRHITLETLALRHPAALTVKQITRRVAMEVDFGIDEERVTGALEFLKGKTPPLAIGVFDEMGSTKHWQATTEGILTGNAPPNPQSQK
jgi:hypothetical protein